MAVERIEIAVDEFYQVRTVLVALVDAALEQQGLNGINLRVAYQILQMPLHRINPALAVEVAFNSLLGIRIGNRRIHMVAFVIIADHLLEYGPATFCKFHLLKVYRLLIAKVV